MKFQPGNEQFSGMNKGENLKDCSIQRTMHVKNQVVEMLSDKDIESLQGAFLPGLSHSRFCTE